MGGANIGDRKSPSGSRPAKSLQKEKQKKGMSKATKLRSAIQRMKTSQKKKEPLTVNEKGVSALPLGTKIDKGTSKLKIRSRKKEECTGENTHGAQGADKSLSTLEASSTQCKEKPTTKRKKPSDKKTFCSAPTKAPVVKKRKTSDSPPRIEEEVNEPCSKLQVDIALLMGEPQAVLGDAEAVEKKPRSSNPQQQKTEVKIENTKEPSIGKASKEVDNSTECPSMCNMIEPEGDGKADQKLPKKKRKTPGARPVKITRKQPPKTKCVKRMQDAVGPEFDAEGGPMSKYKSDQPKSGEKSEPRVKSGKKAAAPKVGEGRPARKNRPNKQTKVCASSTPDEKVELPKTAGSLKGKSNPGSASKRRSTSRASKSTGRKLNRRMASLNARMMINCLMGMYENDSPASGAAKGSSSSAEKTPENLVPDAVVTKQKAAKIRVCGVVDGEVPKDSETVEESANDEAESTTERAKPAPKKRMKKAAPKARTIAAGKKKKAKADGEAAKKKTVPVPKRIASLNATAIMAASYQPGPSPRKNSSVQSDKRHETSTGATSAPANSAMEVDVKEKPVGSKSKARPRSQATPDQDAAVEYVPDDPARDAHPTFQPSPFSVNGLIHGNSTEAHSSQIGALAVPGMDHGKYFSQRIQAFRYSSSRSMTHSSASTTPDGLVRAHQSTVVEERMLVAPQPILPEGYRPHDVAPCPPLLPMPERPGFWNGCVGQKWSSIGGVAGPGGSQGVTAGQRYSPLGVWTMMSVMRPPAPPPSGYHCPSPSSPSLVQSASCSAHSFNDHNTTNSFASRADGRSRHSDDPSRPYPFSTSESPHRVFQPAGPLIDARDGASSSSPMSPVTMEPPCTSFGQQSRGSLVKPVPQHAVPLSPALPPQNVTSSSGLKRSSEPCSSHDSGTETRGRTGSCQPPASAVHQGVWAACYAYPSADFWRPPISYFPLSSYSPGFQPHAPAILPLMDQPFYPAELYPAALPAPDGRYYPTGYHFAASSAPVGGYPHPGPMPLPVPMAVPLAMPPPMMSRLDVAGCSSRHESPSQGLRSDPPPFHGVLPGLFVDPSSSCGFSNAHVASSQAPCSCSRPSCPKNGMAGPLTGDNGQRGPGQDSPEIPSPDASSDPQQAAVARAGSKSKQAPRDIAPKPAFVSQPTRTVNASDAPPGSAANGGETSEMSSRNFICQAAELQRVPPTKKRPKLAAEKRQPTAGKKQTSAVDKKLKKNKEVLNKMRNNFRAAISSGSGSSGIRLLAKVDGVPVNVHPVAKVEDLPGPSGLGSCADASKLMLMEAGTAEPTGKNSALAQKRKTETTSPSGVDHSGDHLRKKFKPKPRLRPVLKRADGEAVEERARDQGGGMRDIVVTVVPPNGVQTPGVSPLKAAKDRRISEGNTPEAKASDGRKESESSASGVSKALEPKAGSPKTANAERKPASKQKLNMKTKIAGCKSSASHSVVKAKKNTVAEKKTPKISAKSVGEKKGRGKKEKKMEEGADRLVSEMTLGPLADHPRWSNGWAWHGAPSEGPVFLKGDGRAVMRKCYPAIVHQEGDVVRVRDCILLRSGSKKLDLPFVAKVTALWESPGDREMMVSVLWYYRREQAETNGLPDMHPNEVLASRHRDVIVPACIEDKCFVLTFNEYARYHALIKMIEEGVVFMNSVVPEPSEPYPRQEALPKSQMPPDRVFFCHRVYDFRQRRILKNPA